MRGLRLTVRPWPTMGCVVVGGMRAGRCRVATQPSSWLPGTAKRRPWRWCWNAALKWRPRATSAHWLRHRHVAPLAWFEVAMRPSAVPGVIGLLLLGRRGRERALGSGVSGAGAGRARASVDIETVADAGVCGCGWYACWALQDGDTALFWAALHGKVEAVALLLDRGADLEAKSIVSKSPVPRACPAAVVRGRDGASCSAGHGGHDARAAGPSARTGQRRVRGGCGAGDGFG